MILTCPDCSTRYSVKDGSIGPSGRTVRCSSCSATWFVSSDADSLALQDNEHDDIAVVEMAAQTQTQAQTVSPPEATPPVSAPPLEDDPSHLTSPVVGAHVHMRDKADRERRNKRLVGVALIWGVTLGILLIAGVIGFVKRQDIVDRNPAMASFYEKALKTPVKVAGLDFESPRASHTIIDGRPVLVINGMIINRSNKSQTVPMIELSLFNGKGEKVTAWLIEPDEAEIGPKQRLPYMSQYPNPPLDAVDLKYRFKKSETLSNVSETN